MSVAQQIPEIINWLQHMTASAGAKGLVVGVSGGVDSAVVAGLIQQAMPGAALGLIMPCKSNPQDASDAQEVCMTVGLPYQTVDLSDAHQSIMKSIGISDIETPETRLADANLRARLRMSTLYAVANQRNLLVVGTDNADEVYCGYFTKYGDGGVDLLPIAGFTKGEVRQIASALGIPQAIIGKVPSAGLWPGQTDEEEMGITYRDIDAFLEGKPVSDWVRERILYLHHISAHKRKLPPSFVRTDGKVLLAPQDVP